MYPVVAIIKRNFYRRGGVENRIGNSKNGRMNLSSEQKRVGIFFGAATALGFLAWTVLNRKKKQPRRMLHTMVGLLFSKSFHKVESVIHFITQFSVGSVTRWRPESG
jgi:hypothetical protein